MQTVVDILVLIHIVRDHGSISYTLSKDLHEYLLKITGSSARNLIISLCQCHNKLSFYLIIRLGVNPQLFFRLEVFGIINILVPCKSETLLQLHG